MFMTAEQAARVIRVAVKDGVVKDFYHGFDYLVGLTDVTLDKEEVGVIYDAILEDEE